jgi:hypothetical protein
MVVAAFVAVALTLPSERVVRPAERAAFEAMVRITALGADAKYSGAPICAAAGVEALSSEAVKVPGHPEVGALHERVRVSGCGRSSIQNVNVIRFAGRQPWRMAAALPGESLADMGLQQTLWPIVLAEAGEAVPKACQGPELNDVYVAARPGHVALPPPGEASPAQQQGKVNIRLAPQVEAQRDNLDVSKAWIEVWPLKMCGLDRTQAILLIPLRDKAAVFHLEIPVWKIALERGTTTDLPPAPAE